MNQCSILYIQHAPRGESHVNALKTLGFSVDVTDDVPPSEVFVRYHAVVVCTRDCNLPALGMRLRAKPRFGRRVLVGLVPESCTEQQRREGTHCGFDVTLPYACSPRDLAARILSGLRQFPEYRCLLRAPNGRRKAA